MNKHLILCALIALFCLSCSKKDEPTNVQKHQVTFHVPSLKVDTQPMDAPHCVAPLTDDDGQQMTQLLMFDGSDLLVQQSNTDPNFGTITVLLTTGNHNLHFIATRSTGLAYNEGILSFESLRPTFGKHYNLNVSGSSDENIAMDRLTGQIAITIEDEIPSGAQNLRIQMGDIYMGIDPTTFNGVRTGGFDQTVSISGKVGTTDNEWKLNVLSPIYGAESTTTFTLTATNTSSQIIGQATGTIPICSNTKTLLHGNLFIGTKSIFSLSTSWGADNDVDF